MSTSSPIDISMPPTPMWEVALVSACPVVLVVCLCICIVCIVLRRNPAAESQQIETIRSRTRRSPLSQILRQLPPPPKYDVAVTNTSPPPLYSDAEKGLIFDPLAAFAAQRRRHHDTSGTNSLSIQYLYPPKYESASQPADPMSPESSGSPPVYDTSSTTSPSSSSSSLSRISSPSLSTSSSEIDLDQRWQHATILSF